MGGGVAGVGGKGVMGYGHGKTQIISPPMVWEAGERSGSACVREVNPTA